MPWKESYKTRTGARRYKVVTQDAAGKKSSKSFDRSKDADAYLLELKRREQLGHLWQDDPDTFGKFAGITVNAKGRVVLTDPVSGWFERYRPSVSDSTYDRRHSVIGHLRDLLDVRLDRITPAMIEELTLKLQGEHPRQAKFVDETIKMILRSAKVRGQRVNPDVFDVRPPYYEPKRRRQALGLEDVEALAEASDDPHLIRLAAYTGLRQGELFALRDEDIDFKGKLLHVNGTVYNRKRYDKPKTKNSIRVIPMTPETEKEIRLQMLRRKTGTEILFPGKRSGGYRSVRKLEIDFKLWAERIGKDITFHDLRSTFASFMVEADTNPAVLQELMGHKDIKTTIGIYTRLKTEKKREAMDGLSALLAGSGTPSDPPSAERAATDLA
jgi:integrase